MLGVWRPKKADKLQPELLVYKCFHALERELSIQAASDVHDGFLLLLAAEDQHHWEVCHLDRRVGFLGHHRRELVACSKRGSPRQLVSCIASNSPSSPQRLP
jgi:hypothetical protein